MKQVDKIIYDAIDFDCSYVEVASDSIDINIGYIDTLDLSEKQYDKFYNDIYNLAENYSNTFLKDTPYRFSVGFDVSGYDYWTNTMQASNYLYICVYFPFLSSDSFFNLSDNMLNDIIYHVRKFEEQISELWANIYANS